MSLRSLVPSNRPPRVEVLLATYNGEPFLREQIESLLDQDYANLVITIQDDRSTDGTLAILENYARQPNVTLMQGQHLGLPTRFFALLKAASPASDYVAFADQDDVWLPHKVSRAVKILTEVAPDDRPRLYCARCVVVDAQLKPLGHTPVPRRGLSFANSLVENVATGCTILINRAAREALVREFPREALFHDWWCYQVVSGLGDVIFDPEPVILYRQHGGASMGTANNPVARLLRRIRRQLGGEYRGWIPNQVFELRRIFYSDLPLCNQEILNRFLDARADLITRLRYALTGAAYRQSLIEDIAFKLLYATNKI